MDSLNQAVIAETPVDELERLASTITFVQPQLRLEELTDMFGAFLVETTATTDSNLV